MKRFRPSLRRVLSFAAAAFAGAAATLFMATPAFAHHTNVVGTPSCDPAGGWNVAWTVTSWTPRQPPPDKWDLVSISQTTSGGSGDAITGQLAGPFASAGGTFVPPGKGIGESFTGNQHFPDSVTWVKLTANGIWNNHNSGTGTSDKVYKPDNCAPVPVVPKVDFKDNCDGTVTVTLDNTQGSAPVTFKLNGDKTVPGGEKLDVIIPAGSGKITVEITGQPAKDVKEHTWTQPQDCPTSTPTPSPTTPVTGASVTGTIGIGAGLLAGGIAMIALVYLMRRRRTVAGQ